MNADLNSKIGSDGTVKLMTKRELAGCLAVSVSMVDKLLVKGIPRYKIGRSVRFDLGRVMSAIEVRKADGEVREDPKASLASTSGNHRESPTIRDVVESWKKEAWPHIKTNTRLQYARCIEFIEPLNGRQIETIKAADIDQLIAGWKLKNIKSHQRISFVKEYDVVKMVFIWYQRNFDDAKLTLPFKDRHKKQILVKAKAKAVRRFMTEDETKAFLSALREEGELYFVIAAIQIMQLMRISEVLAMRWSNLDAKNNQYHLCEHVVWERLGGVKPRLEAGTKTIKAGEVYTINLFQQSVALISSLVRHKKSDLIFHDGGDILTYRQVQYRFDNAFKKAGLPFRATHVLRHTGATRFYNLSGDILALQHMGTWADARMAQHYAKISSVRAKEAISKISSQAMIGFRL